MSVRTYVMILVLLDRHTIRKIRSFCIRQFMHIESWRTGEVELCFVGHTLEKINILTTALCVKKTLLTSSLKLYISLEVYNLFLSVPSDECLESLRELLFHFVLSTHQILDMLLLVGLTLEQNFFIFNNVLYFEDFGLAMGSNLSPFLTKIFMASHEHVIFFFFFQKSFFVFLIC